MKLIVGLGNPGKKYDGTRHNIGFDVLNLLAERHSMGPAGRAPMQAKFESLVMECRIELPKLPADQVDADAGEQDDRVLFVWPQTYMNNSGQAARQAARFYKLPPEDLLVICDDFHLPTGKLRTRPKGSAGGQKGLNDIIQQMGTDQIARLRVGVGPIPEGWDNASFVLGKFGKNEQDLVEQTIHTAADAATSWVRQGVLETMNRFN